MANRTPLKDVALNSWTEENKDLPNIHNIFMEIPIKQLKLLLDSYIAVISYVSVT